MRTEIPTQNDVTLDIQPCKVSEHIADGKQVSRTEVCLQITDTFNPDRYLVAMLSPEDAKTLADRLTTMAETIEACQ